MAFRGSWPQNNTSSVLVGRYDETSLLLTMTFAVRADGSVDSTAKKLSNYSYVYQLAEPHLEWCCGFKSHHSCFFRLKQP